MYPNITCFSCNNSLGAYYLIYKYILEEYLAAKYTINSADSNAPTSIQNSAGRLPHIHTTLNEIECGELLSQLGFTKPCCVTAIITGVDIGDYKRTK